MQFRLDSLKPDATRKTLEEEIFDDDFLDSTRWTGEMEPRWAARDYFLCTPTIPQKEIDHELAAEKLQLARLFHQAERHRNAQRVIKALRLDLVPGVIINNEILARVGCDLDEQIDMCRRQLALWRHIRRLVAGRPLCDQDATTIAEKAARRESGWPGGRRKRANANGLGGDVATAAELDRARAKLAAMFQGYDANDNANPVAATAPSTPVASPVVVSPVVVSPVATPSTAPLEGCGIILSLPATAVPICNSTTVS